MALGKSKRHFFCPFVEKNNFALIQPSDFYTIPKNQTIRAYRTEVSCAVSAA
jgi:alcohol dehydrogenase YqhD (iron-dependent ADH family)